MPTRREMLQGAVGAAAVAAAPTRSGAATRPGGEPVFLVPGYYPDRAFRGGRPLAEDAAAARGLPPRHAGPVTLVTRLQRAAAPRSALMPIRGHSIQASPDGQGAAFAAMDGPTLILFDPASLDVLRVAEPHADGFVFGGHAVYDREGAVLFATERRNHALAYTGRLADYGGRVSVRDARSLQVLDVFDGHGIAPHDIVLLGDGRHLAVANYGSTPWPADASAPAAGLPHGVAPSLSVIDAGDGRLAHFVPLDQARNELRHVAAGGLDRVFGLQMRLESFDSEQRLLRGGTEVYEPDRSDPEGRGSLPVPVLRFDLSGPAAAASRCMAGDPLLMRRGQSIVYEPVHDEAIGVFTSAHAIVAFDGASGAPRAAIRTDRLGLRLPRGIALCPDGETYAVSGHWADVFVFRRGRHDVVREACCFAPLFGHSHLAVA